MVISVEKTARTITPSKPITPPEQITHHQSSFRQSQTTTQELEHSVRVNEGFIDEVTASLSLEGEARMDNDALKPRFQWKVTTL